MTRIAGVPDQLRGVATALRGTAGDLDALANRLSGLSYPSMPADTQATVSGLVASASARLRKAAIVADAAGGDARKRASWFDAADALLASTAVRAPKETVEELFSALDLKERMRVDQMLKEWQRWNRVVPDVVDEYGEDSMAATRIWFIFQERSPLTRGAFLDMLEGAGERASYTAAADVPLTALRAVAGKVLGPLGIYTNLELAFHPDHSGWRGDGDRASGWLGAGGSVGATMLAFGAAVPGLDVAVGAALLVAGGWQLGNLVWDNKTAIARAAVAGAKFLSDHAGYLVDPIGQLAWDHRTEIARAAVGVATWGADHAEEAAQTALHVAGQGLSAGEHLAGDAIHGALHGAEDTGKAVVGGLEKIGGIL